MISADQVQERSSMDGGVMVEVQDLVPWVKNPKLR